MDFSDQDVRIFLLGVSVTIALFMMVFAVRNRIRDNRIKLEVIHGFAHQMIQEGGTFLPGSTPFLYVEVKNCGAKVRYIEKPAIKFSEKINNQDTFYVMTVDDPDKWPQKLEPGAIYRKETNLLNLHQSLTSKLSPSGKIRFEITDTLGKVHKSKWFKVSDIIEQIQIASNLD